MKTLLKIFLISSTLYACRNAGENKNASEVDSVNAPLPPVTSSKKIGSGNASAAAAPEDINTETRRQATAVLLSSKQEINALRSELSDSLSKTGLPTQKRVLFAKTIQQLESTSDLVNKQLEQILVSDLQNSREKLGAIVKKMKDSEQQLGALIARIDKISGYLLAASDLIQSLSPIKSPAVKATKTK